MKISTKGRYAITLMLDIAKNSNGSCISLKDIADRQGLSMKYLEQIVSQLSKAGMLRSERGAQGGYRLSKKPEEYTIGSILRLTEGTLAPVSCLEGDECKRCAQCSTIDFWGGLYKVIVDYIDKYTLADMLDSDSSEIRDRFLSDAE